MLNYAVTIYVKVVIPVQTGIQYRPACPVLDTGVSSVIFPDSVLVVIPDSDPGRNDGYVVAGVIICEDLAPYPIVTFTVAGCI